MTNKELQDILSKFPNNAEIICTRCSDYQLVTPDEISLIQAIEEVSGKDGWIRSYAVVNNDLYTSRTDYRKHQADPGRVKTYIHFAGN